MNEPSSRSVPPSGAGPELRTATKERLLPLLEGDDASTAALRMRDALQASRETSLRLAHGRPDGLTRTYSARLADAQEHGVATVGIPALLDAVASNPEEHLWGFTVRDSTMIYVAFADADLQRLVGVVIMARKGAERLMAT